MVGDTTVKPKTPVGVPLKKVQDTSDDDLSDEDRQLQDELNMLIQRLDEPNEELYQAALESMKTLIKSSTTSMTSVPKPLKFLRPHYNKMKQIYEKIEEAETKKICAEVVSVLGMTMTDKPETKFDTLTYRLLSSYEAIGAWGHEYVRHLTSQIVEKWQEHDLSSDDEFSDDARALKEQYLNLVEQIVPYLMEHNAEAESIDLCIEIEQLQFLEKYTSKLNYQRVCLYMTSCVAYIPDPDNMKVLRCAANLYRKFNDLGNAMRCALRLNDGSLTKDIFTESAALPANRAGVSGTEIKKQLSYLLGRQQFITPYEEAIADDEEDVAEMLGNTRLSENFLSLARELDIMDPKVPEDIYKSHLESVRQTLSTVTLDSARANLAASYVNGLINCGFGKEKLLQEDSKDVPWLSKQKELGKMSTVATLGWVLLWDVDSGLSQIDKYLYASDNNTQAGALLGCGVVNCGVKNECDPALALLGCYVENPTDVLSRAAIIGLGVAYAGSMKADALTTLTPAILDITPTRLQHACLAALSAGMIAVGSLNDDVTSTILQTMLERPASNWTNTFSKFMALGLALTCFGRQEEADVILASLEAVSEPMKSMAHMMCDICAYAGTGNVLKIQSLLHILSEAYEEKDKDDKNKNASDKSSSKSTKEREKKESSRRVGTRSRTRRAGHSVSETSGTAEPMDMTTTTKVAHDTEKASSAEGTAMQVDDGAEPATEDAASGFEFHAHQGLAVLGVALISMGEEIGLEMAFRMFGHLLRFGETPIKRAVPLALALCYISNPQLKVLDTLSKFSHDSDQELCFNSILAMGLVGAGTNNARLAAMLRQLAVYHTRDPYSLFLVRLAQGLTHLGKGTLTLSPWHSDRFLLRPVSLAGILTLLVACLDMRTTFMGRNDYLMFYLTPAIQPRLLMTFDTDLKPLTVTVRVGQAVDVVGQAGRPKTITGFQTHTTPVLLSHGERAELATDEYLPVTNLPMEGFIILTKNPDYEDTTK